MVKSKPPPPPSSSSSSSETRMPPARKMQPFIQTAFTMLSDASCAHAIRFSSNGLDLEILDIKALECDVLPWHFKHGKLNSFVRQLNMHGFRAKRCSPTNGPQRIFHHPLFHRDASPDWLDRIERKPVAASGESRDVAELRRADWLARLNQNIQEWKMANRATVPSSPSFSAAAAAAAVDEEAEEDGDAVQQFPSPHPLLLLHGWGEEEEDNGAPLDFAHFSPSPITTMTTTTTARTTTRLSLSSSNNSLRNSPEYIL